VCVCVCVCACVQSATMADRLMQSNINSQSPERTECWT